MMRHSIGSTLLLLAALTVAVSSAAASVLQAPSPVVTVTGRAAIYHGDLAGARERAVRAALVRALERYAGLRIEELGHPLWVTVSGAVAADGAAAVRQILKNTRWVRKVTIAREEPSRTVLQVVCTENPAYVVEGLRQEPTFHIRRFDAAATALQVR